MVDTSLFAAYGVDPKFAVDESATPLTSTTPPPAGGDLLSRYGVDPKFASPDSAVGDTSHVDRLRGLGIDPDAMPKVEAPKQRPLTDFSERPADYGHDLWLGVAQTLGMSGEFARWMGADQIGDYLDKQGRTVTAEQLSMMSPRHIEEMNKNIIEKDPSSWLGYKFGDANFRTILSSVLQSTPVSVGTGAAASMAISALPETAIMAMGNLGASSLAKVGIKAAPEAVGKFTAGALFGGGLEGVTSGGMDANQTRVVLDAIPDDVFTASPRYQKEIAGGVDPQTARSNVTQSIVTEVGLKSGAAVTALSAPAEGIFGQIVRGSGKSAIKDIAREALGETGSETLQSGAEQYIQNKGVGTVDPTVRPGDDVLNQAILGGATGGFQGVGMGAAGHAMSPAHTAAEPAPGVPPGTPESGPAVPFPPGGTQAPATPDQQVQLDRLMVAANDTHLGATDPQRDAGNYKKGVYDFAPDNGSDWTGMALKVENGPGTTRSSTDPEKPWTTTMPPGVFYGYMRGITGGEGEGLDAYVTPGKGIHVIEQIDPETGKFDENKLVIGPATPEAAKAVYASTFSDGSGPTRIGAVVALPVDEMKDWAANGDPTKPITDYAAAIPAATAAPAGTTGASPSQPLAASIGAEEQPTGTSVAPQSQPGPTKVPESTLVAKDPKAQGMVDAVDRMVRAAGYTGLTDAAAKLQLNPGEFDGKPGFKSAVEQAARALGTESAQPTEKPVKSGARIAEENQAIEGSGAPAILAHYPDGPVKGVIRKIIRDYKRSAKVSAAIDDIDVLDAQKFFGLTGEKTASSAYFGRWVRETGGNIRKGAIALANPKGTGFDVLEVAHELGHVALKANGYDQARLGDVWKRSGPSTVKTYVERKYADQPDHVKGEELIVETWARMLVDKHTARPGEGAIRYHVRRIAQWVRDTFGQITGKSPMDAFLGSVERATGVTIKGGGAETQMAASRRDDEPVKLPAVVEKISSLMREPIGKQFGEPRLRRAMKRAETPLYDRPGKPSNERKTYTKGGVTVTVGPITNAAWLTRVRKMLSDVEIKNARAWYHDVLPAFTSRLGERDGAVYALAWHLANVQASPSVAMQNAIAVAEETKRGKSSGLQRGLSDTALRAIFQDKRAEAGVGQKLFDFLDSSMGKTTRSVMGDDPRGGQPATADTWALRDVGFVDDRYFKFIDQHFGEAIGNQIRQDFSKENGATSPSETQYEWTGDFYRQLTDVLNKRSFDGGNWTAAETQAVGWMAMQKLLRDSGETIDYAFNKSTHTFASELAFGEGAPWNESHPDFFDLNDEQKRTVTMRILNRALDIAMRVTGAKEIVRIHGVGGWQDYGVQPNVQSTVLATPETLSGLMDTVGYLAQQTEIFGVTMNPDGGSIAIDIFGPGNFLADDANISRVWETLRAQSPDSFAGFSPIVHTDGRAGIRAVLPIGSVASETAATKAARINGLIDELRGRLTPVVQAASDLVGADLYFRAVRVDTVSSRNDWTEDQDGQGYLGRIGAAFGPGVSDSVRDTYGPELGVELGRAISDVKIGTNPGVQGSGEDDIPFFSRRKEAPAASVSLDRRLAEVEPSIETQREVYGQFGKIENRDTTDELKVYNLEPIISNRSAIDDQLQRYGKRVEYFAFHEDPDAGVTWRLPQLKRNGYAQGTLWIYDPRVAHGSFKDTEYTRAWRITHELGHAISEQLMTDKYGASKREGRLGREGKSYRGRPGKTVEIKTEPLTTKQAQRALEWEDAAFRIQRKMLEELGIKISDQDFAREYNINVSDAMYRVITGDFGNPGEVGMVPNDKLPSLKSALRRIASVEAEIAKTQDRQPTDGIDLKTWKPISDAEIDKAVSDASTSGTMASRRNTDTEEFKKWFSGSKVVNADGTPMVMYHATAATTMFDAFKRKLNDVGIHFGTIGQANDRYEYLTEMRTKYPVPSAKPVGDWRVIPAYLQIRNPLRLDDAGHWGIENIDTAIISSEKFARQEISDAVRGIWSKTGQLTAIINLIKSKGYDGIVYRNTGEVGGASAARAEQSRTHEIVVAMHMQSNKSFSVFSKEQQQTPEYKAWQMASEAEREFREKNAEDSYVAFDARQIKSVFNNFDAGAASSRLFSRRDDIDTPMFSKRVHGTQEQEDAIKRVMHTEENQPGVLQRFRQSFAKIWTPEWRLDLLQGTVDEFASIADREKTLHGGLQDAGLSAYKAMHATNNINDVMAATFMHGPLVYDDQDGTFKVDRSAPGLIEIMKPVAEKGLMQLWKGWAMANRAQRLLNEGRERLMTQKEINDLLPLANQYPEFRPTLDALQAYKRRFLDLAVATGTLSQPMRQLIDQDDHVPFYRWSKDEQVSGAAMKKKFSHQSSGVRRLYGGTEQVNDILENIVMNLTHLVDSSMKNQAMQRAVNLLVNTGDATHQGMQFKPVMVPEQQIEKYIQSIYSPAFRLSQIASPQLRKAMVEMFQVTAPADPETVRVMVNGKAEYYHVDDDLLLRALKNLTPMQLSGFMKLFMFPKKLLTSAVTLAPGFAIRNFVRDTISSWVAVDSGKIPGAGAIKGLANALAMSDNMIDMMAAGGGAGGFYHATPQDVRHIMERELPKDAKDRILSSPHKVWRFYHRILNASEMANRLATFDRVKAKGGTTAEAAYQARDLLNFTMRGDWPIIKFLISTVPFTNARIQGLAKLARSAKDNPTSFLIKGGLLLAASIALAVSNIGRKEYDQLEEWDKDTYYHFWIGNEHFRIPKPFEVGVIFSSIPERALRLANGNDNLKEFLTSMSGMVQNNLSMNPVPQALMPLLEQYANVDNFTGRPIVPAGQQELEPQAQMSPSTSPTMVELGQLLGMSPMRMQALYTDYTATFGTYILAAADAVTREAMGYPQQPKMRADQMEIIKDYYRKEPAASTKYVTQYYQMRDRAVAAQKTVQAYMSRGDLDAARGVITSEPSNLRNDKIVSGVDRMFGAIARAERAIYLDPNMAPEVKRLKLDQLTARRNDLAERAVKVMQ